MGIITRQGFKLSIVTYIGIVLGYVNVVLLFPNILEPEQFGLTRILIAIGVIALQVGQLGTPQIIIKYFPYFQSEENKHSGILFLMLLINFVGFIIICSFLFIFQSEIQSIYIERSKLFVEYYHLIYPIFGFLLLFRVFNSYAQVLYKAVIPMVLKTIVLRIFNTIILVILYLKLISFEEYILLFVYGYAIQILLVFIYLKGIKQLFLLPSSIMSSGKMREMLKYGLYLCLSGVATILMNQIDILMLGWLAGLDHIAVYSVAFLFGNIIQIPARSIYIVVLPMIATAWKENDFEKIKDLYRTVSNNQLIIGFLLFIGIWSNLNNILAILPDSYADGKYVIFMIGFAQLFYMGTGISNGIINTSKLFRYDLLINTILVVVAITTNYLFIPEYGINGAAFATALSICLFNTIRMVFVFIKFKIHPFTWNTFKLLMISIAVMLIGYYLPQMGNIWLDIVVRSILITAIFTFLILHFRISDIVNDNVHKYWKIALEKMK
ncbi:MAG: hypothetical protein COC01_10280 [Bacteroidetes bacterium]|nr:oligosaccharide flippase family protein [Bacteroidia bacterium]PCH65146.1 MAG: hypothetical protein COC01_10280 [Bacteroidota bacterium]